MGAILEVEVLLQAGHSEQSEAQLRKGDRPWEGSVERNREPMNKGDGEEPEREVSRGRSSRKAKGRTRRTATRRVAWQRMASEARQGGECDAGSRWSRGRSRTVKWPRTRVAGGTTAPSRWTASCPSP